MGQAPCAKTPWAGGWDEGESMHMRITLTEAQLRISNGPGRGHHARHAARQTCSTRRRAQDGCSCATPGAWHASIAARGTSPRRRWCHARSVARSCVSRQERGTCAAPGARHILGVRSAPSSGPKDRPKGTRHHFVMAQGEASRAEGYIGETEEQQRSPTAAAAGRSRHAGQPPCLPARRTSMGASRSGV